MTASDPEARSSTLILLSIENKTYDIMMWGYNKMEKSNIDIKITILFSLYLFFAVYLFLAEMKRVFRVDYWSVIYILLRNKQMQWIYSKKRNGLVKCVSCR